MNSFSYTREPPSYERPFMARPAPDGYRKPRGDEEIGMFYACLTCGANVSPSMTELHTDWHSAPQHTVDPT
jgi:hypothetical protein